MAVTHHSFKSHKYGKTITFYFSQWQSNHNIAQSLLSVGYTDNVKAAV